MRYFEKELEQFLWENALPGVENTRRSDGWSHFLHLYVRIVEDSPLVMATTNAAASIATVTLKTELARKSCTWRMVL